MVRKIIPLSDTEMTATLLSEDSLRYCYNRKKYFDEDYKRKAGIWDKFKIISTTIIDADLDDPTIDYLVIVQHLPSGEYYSGSIRELPGEDYQPLCEELVQVFPTPITEIKYI